MDEPYLDQSFQLWLNERELDELREDSFEYWIAATAFAAGYNSGAKRTLNLALHTIAEFPKRR